MQPFTWLADTGGSSTAQGATDATLRDDHGWIYVPAADDDGDRPRCGLQLSGQHRADCHRAASLSQDPVAEQREAHRLGDLLLGHQHVIIDEPHDGVEGPAVVQADAAGQHLGNGVLVRQVDRVTGAHARHHGRSVLSRDAGYPDGRTQPLQADAEAADEPASGHGGGHRGETGNLVEQFQADRALPRDDLRIVERVHIAEPALALEVPGHRYGLIERRAAKDYLFGWLTGEIATDPSTASGFGCYELEAGGWNAEVIAAAASLAGRALPALPPVLPSTTCRPLRSEAAARLRCGQIPVCLGAADSVLGALGLGVRHPGQVAYIAGTSNVIIGVADRLLLDPRHRFLVTPLAEPGHWGLEMDLLATGSAISWLAGLLGDDPDEAALVALAAGTDPRDAPLVLPYLSPGEQGALWDPLLHGTFVGLDLGHERRHLARGLVNGILLESRRCLAVLDETGNFGHDLEVAGNSATDPAFRADLADATRRRVSMPGDHDTEYSARGAALLAARGVDGEWPLSSFAGTGPVVEPDSGRAVIWDELWADYERARTAIAGHYHATATRDNAGPTGRHPPA